MSELGKNNANGGDRAGSVWLVGIWSGNQALTRCAFCQPEGITSGLPVTRSQSRIDPA
jgi:hypothetical protein